MWSTHTVEYYSAMENNEARTRAAIWVKVENMLHERGQTQRTT